MENEKKDEEKKGDEDHRRAAKHTIDALCDDVTKLGYKPITSKLVEYIKREYEEKND